MPILDSVVRATKRLKFVVFSCLILSSLGYGSEKSGSLSELTSVWKDQKGGSFAWKDIQGKVVLLSMVYTSCEQTCPLIISELGAVQKALPEPQRQQIVVLVFSFDPARDTPERLAQYAKERNLNPAWRLLRAPDEDVQELAAVLGVRYKKLTTGDFAHSNIFTVLNKKGEISHQQTDLFKGRSETLKVIQSLMKD